MPLAIVNHLTEVITDTERGVPGFRATCACGWVSKILHADDPEYPEARDEATADGIDHEALFV